MEIITNKKRLETGYLFLLMGERPKKGREEVNGQ